MNEERKLQKVKINIARSPLFAAMHGGIMTGTTRVCDKAPTAYTDGYNEVYGRELVKHLPEKQLAFVVAHENMHKLKRDLTTYRKLMEIDARCAGQATDHVINLSLIALDPGETVIAMPRYWDGPNKGAIMGLADPRFKGMDVLTVFRILQQEQEGGKGDEPGEGDEPPDDGGNGDGEGEGREPDDGDGEGDGDGDGEGDTPKPPKPKKPKNSKPKKPKPGTGGDGEPTDHGGFDQHDWKKANGHDTADRERIEKEIDQAVREGLLAAERFKGVGGGDLARELGELSKPKINWKEALRDFVKSACAGKDKSTWKKPNRRMIGEDVYMPSLISERVKSIVVAVDTSGSIRVSELNRFLSEIQSIAEEVKPETVHLLYWDGRIAAHEEYNDGAVSMIVQSTKPVGGGGTSPTVVSQYLNEKRMKPECIVMFTDGHVGADWGSNWPAPILWVILNNPSAIAAHGLTANINEGV